MKLEEAIKQLEAEIRVESDRTKAAAQDDMPYNDRPFRRAEKRLKELRALQSLYMRFQGEMQLVARTDAGIVLNLFCKLLDYLFAKEGLDR